MLDPVLNTLVLPFNDGSIAWPETGTVQFLRARNGDALADLPRDRLVCEQTFKPMHNALGRAGFALRDGDDGQPCALTLVLPPRQREESRALLARAVASTQPGGLVLAAVSNLEGARTVEGDLKSLAGNAASLSKHKCRAFWARIDPALSDDTLIDAWGQLDAPRPIAATASTGLGFVSRPGLFAWDHIDAGSKLLADHLPTLNGVVADLGTGFGYLSAEALGRSPGITRLDAIEAEKRALDMARQNLAGFGERVAFHWLDATGPLPATYDAVISNPPFHIDRADRHNIGKAFIVSAARALKPNGQLWMVANRHLPYEETLKGTFKNVTVIAENGYFKVFRGVGVKKA